MLGHLGLMMTDCSSLGKTDCAVLGTNDGISAGVTEGDTLRTDDIPAL